MGAAVCNFHRQHSTDANTDADTRDTDRHGRTQTDTGTGEAGEARAAGGRGSGWRSGHGRGSMGGGSGQGLRFESAHPAAAEATPAAHREQGWEESKTAVGKEQGMGRGWVERAGGHGPGAGLG